MVKCQIAGINIGLDYKYDLYFKNNIENYLNPNIKVDHIIKVIYQNNLNKIPHTKILSKDKDNNIRSMVYYDELYKEVLIYIDPKHFRKESLAHAEYIYMGMLFLEISFLHDYLPLHGAAITINDCAVIFSAPSGTGKSTHARLWHERYLDDVKYINDDKPLLKVIDNELIVFGSPFSGEDKKNNNTNKPLKGIVFLEQSKNNEISLIDNNLIVPLIIKNILRPEKEEFWDKVLNIINFIANNIPIYKLKADISYNAVETVYNKLFKGDKNEN